MRNNNLLFYSGKILDGHDCRTLVLLRGHEEEVLMNSEI